MSNVKRVVNFLYSAFNHAANNFLELDEAGIAERVKVCEGCATYFDAEHRVCKHENCNCYVDVKARWADQDCPVNKWPKIGLPMVVDLDTEAKAQLEAGNAGRGCCGG